MTPPLGQKAEKKKKKKATKYLIDESERGD